MVKMTLLEDQNLTVNFDFRDHIATFEAVNTLKRGPCIAENNASEQLQTNFQKVQKTYFLAQKMVKSRVQILKNGQNLSQKSRFWWSPNNILGR